MHSEKPLAGVGKLIRRRSAIPNVGRGGPCSAGPATSAFFGILVRRLSVMGLLGYGLATEEWWVIGNVNSLGRKEHLGAMRRTLFL